MKNLYKIIFVSLAIIPSVLFGQRDLVISGGNTVSSFVCNDLFPYVWGKNDAGQLGLGTVGADVTTPTRVFVGGNPGQTIKQLNSGSGAHFVGLDCDNNVWAWGNNTNGQTGQTPGATTTVPSRVPVTAGSDLDGTRWDVGGFLGNVDVVYAGNETSFAILDDGRLVGWGADGAGPDNGSEFDDSYGQLGRNRNVTTFDNVVANFPVPGFVKTRVGGAVVDLPGVIQVFAGDRIAMALSDPDGDGLGTVYSWGYGLNSTLGREPNGAVGLAGDHDDVSSIALPVRYPDGSIMDNVRQIATADAAGFALDENGYIWSWGDSWNGLTGKPGGNSALPGRVVDGGVTGPNESDGTYLLASSIQGGQGFAMAVTAEGRPVAWGGGGCNVGQGGLPGNGSTTAGNGASPEYVEFGPGSVHDDVLYINRGDTWGYYGRANGTVWAWGCNNDGFLGDGSTAISAYAKEIVPPCSLRDPAPQINLTPGDMQVCDPVSVTLNSNLVFPTGEGSKYTLNWYLLPDLITPVQSGTANNASNLTYTATAAGTYRLEAFYNQASACSPYETLYNDVTLTIPTANFSDPGGLKFCGSNATVNVNESGTAIGAANTYEWYTRPTAGDVGDRLIGTSTDDNDLSITNFTGIQVGGTAPNRTATVYVEDVSSFTSTFGNPLPNGGGNNGLTDVNIAVSTPFALNSIDAKVFSNNNDPIEVEFTVTRPGGGTTTHVGVAPADNCGGLCANAKTLVFTPAVNFGVVGNYNIEATGGPNVASFTAGGTYPQNFINSGVQVFSITGKDTRTDIANGYLALTNWNVTAGNPYPCGRIAVQLEEECLCAKPTVVNAGTDVDVCPTENTTLSGSFTASTNTIANGNMYYVWYQSGTTPTAADYTINPPATGITQAVNNVSATNDGDWILRVQDGNNPTDAACYTESTVNIGIKPLPTATLETGGTFCPEDLGMTGSESLTITPSGTSEDYTVAFTGGSGSPVTITNGSTGTINNLVAGTYQLTSITSDGCTVDLTAVANTSATIAEHPALVVTPSTDCNNASQTATVSATITGGVPAGYTFSSVSPGTDGAINTVAGVETFSQTFTANGNTNYAYTISDGTSCDNNEEIITGTTDCSCNVMGTLTATTPSTICPGGSVTLSVAASGGIGTGYTVVLNTPGGGTIPTTLSGGNYVATVSAPGAYTINEISSTGPGACTGVGNGSVTVVVRDNVAITTDLTAGDVFLCPGQPLNLSVVATGSGVVASGNALQYQWTRDAVNVGTNSNAFTKNVVDNATDGGDYQVTVTGECNFRQSAVVSVTVDEPVVATFDASALDICENDAINLAVTGVTGTGTRSGAANTAGPITYTWTNTSTNGTTSTTANLNIASADPDDSGNYSVSVEGQCNTVNLGPKAISVTPSTVITTQPSLVNTDLCPTEELDVTVAATPPGVTYQWFFDGSPIPGQTGTNLNIPSVTNADAGSYTVRVSGPTVNAVPEACGVENSTALPITVGTPPVITTQPLDVGACAGSNALFSVDVSATATAPITYQWYKVSTTGPDVPRAGATSNSLSISPTALSDEGDYYVIVTGKCGEVTSDVVTLTITTTETPTVSLGVDNATICDGDGAIFTASGGGTGSSPTYQFLNQATGAELQAAGASNIYSPTSITDPSGSFTVEVVMTSNSSCLAPGATNPVRSSSTVTLITPATAMITAPGTDPFLTAVDDVNNITATDLGAGYNAVWTKTDPTQQGNISTPGAFVTNLTGLVLIEPDNATDPNAGQGTTNLLVTVSDNGNICPDATDNITIIRKDVSDPTIGPGAVCAADITGATPYVITGSGFTAVETPNIVDVDNISGNGAGFEFTSTNTISLTAPPAITGNSQDFTLTYRVDNSVSGTSPSGSGEFTIYAVPTVANAGPDQDICTDQTTLAAVVPATGLIGTGIWSCDGGNVTDPGNPTSTLTGIADNQVITCTWSTSNVLCSGTSDDVVITNIGNATPAIITFGGDVTTGQNLDICVGDVNSLTGSTPQGSDVGSWSVTNTSGTNYTSVSGAVPNQGNITATQAGQVTLTWTITPSVAACPNSVASTNITVHAEPIADITDILNPSGASVTEICAGTDVTVTTSPNGPTDIASWTSGIIPTGGPDSWNLLSNQLSIGSNLLTYVVNNPGCSPDTDTRTITVNPIDNIDVSLNTVPTQCENDDETITANPTTVGVPTFEFDYSEDGTGVVSQSSNVFNLTNLAVSNGTVTVRMTTTSPCPSVPFAEDIVNINVVPGPAPAILTPNGLICEDSVITINAVDNGSGDPALVTYQWLRNGNVIPNNIGATTFNTLDPLTNVNTGGEYTIRASNGICNPVNSAPMLLDVRNLPFVEASAFGTPNPVIAKSEEGATLTGEHSGLTSTWTLSSNPIATVLDPNSAISELVLDPEEGGRFTATLTSVDGPCTSSDSVRVRITAPISAPNVFTPNGDGDNETFTIKNIETFPGATVRIFNRWGKKVYESDNYSSEEWDGENVPDGVYYYTVELSPDQEKGEGHSGVIHVVR